MRCDWSQPRRTGSCVVKRTMQFAVGCDQSMFADEVRLAKRTNGPVDYMRKQCVKRTSKLLRWFRVNVVMTTVTWSSHRTASACREIKQQQRQRNSARNQQKPKQSYRHAYPRCMAAHFITMWPWPLTFWPQGQGIPRSCHQVWCW